MTIDELIESATKAKYEIGGEKRVEIESTNSVFSDPLAATAITKSRDGVAVEQILCILQNARID